MGSPYVGEIRIFAGNFAPVNWMFCEGQVLAISSYDTLFNLIGTTYGGNGTSTFALPDLRGRLPIHVGPGFAQGQNGGSETVTLAVNQIPSHTHTVFASPSGNSATLPGNNFLAQGPDIYEQNQSGNTTMAATLSQAGGSQPHNNFQPYLCLSFIISLFGVYPSQN